MNNKMNNKGFTLVELLAVFVILLSVSFVAVSGITASLDKRDIRECEEQQELVVSAAKMYFSLDGTGITEVTVEKLKTDGYIKNEEKTDRLNNSDTITITDDGYKYNGLNAGDSCS